MQNRPLNVLWLSLQPGGSTKPVQAQERLRLLAVLGGFRRFLEQYTFGDNLEAVVELNTEQALHAWSGSRSAESGDLRLFLYVAEHLKLHELGQAGQCFMSYGNYPVDGERLFRYGLWDEGLKLLDTAAITEDISHSWLLGNPIPLHPSRGVTLPDADKEAAYGWCKAPRLDSSVVEVGALARQLVDGRPLIRNLVQESGGNVRNRVIARLLESARVVIAMEDWIRRLQPGKPFCHHGRLPDEASGVGLVEGFKY